MGISLDRFRGLVRASWFAAAVVCLLPSEVLAQFYGVVPVEASVGLGALGDRSPSQWSPAIVGALAWDYTEKWWGVFIVEGEVGPTSDAAGCQGPSSGSLDNCADAAVLLGLRFRRPPHAWSGVRPFASVLAGQYWKGSDTNDQSYSSTHSALQVGGGVEVRWPRSIQGLRLSVDYRHVFAGERGRNQFRFLAAYVIGPRRFARRPAASSVSAQGPSR